MYLLKQFKPTCLQFTSTLMLCAIMGQSNAAVTIPYPFAAGTPASAKEVNANFTAVKDAVDTLQISNYVQFGGLAYNMITASTTASELATGTHSFTKANASTKIEVTVNSRFAAGTFASASGIQFEIRVDGVATTYVGNVGTITTSGATEFISMYAVFTGLAAGTHTVSLWAKTNAGTSAGVMADPGGWGGKIIVKEVR
jgi:hypothetical protein